MKKFFSKMRSYIKNTAWIQPILIVVVIFLVLFLLNPIKRGVSNLWTSITTNSNMETITYQQYVEKVNDSKDGTEESPKKYVFVFTQKSCDICPTFYPVMNDYLKATKKTRDFEIYSVNLTTKTKNDSTFYKDKTLGNYTGESDDYAKGLDDRLVEWQNNVTSTGVDTGIDGVGTLTAVGSGFYTYLSTPLVIWYENGVEVKVSNSFDSEVSSDANGDKSYTSFTSFMKFPSSKVVTKLDWHDDFDLTYKK